jgi:hypothetical protein
LPLDPDILLSTPSSNTLNLCPSISVRKKVPQPYKTTVKLILLYILIFKFLQKRREDSDHCCSKHSPNLFSS